MPRTETMTYLEAREKAFSRAVLRAEQGSDPDAFISLFRADLTSLRNSTGFTRAPVVTEGMPWVGDPVRLAAEIEALAAARMLSTLVHVAKCVCVGCQARKAD